MPHPLRDETMDPVGCSDSTRDATPPARTGSDAVPAARVASGDDPSISATLDLRTRALDAITACIAIVDAHDTAHPYLFVNRAFADMQGVDAASLHGQPFRKLPVASDTLDRHGAVLEAMQAGEPARTELLLTQNGGSTAWFGLSVMPVRLDGVDLSHYVIIGADITARLEAERRKQELQDQLYAEMKERERMALELRLAQKLESVGRLAAGVAHEINTPIQYIGDSMYFLQGAMTDLEALLTRYRDVVAMFDNSEYPAAMLAELHEAEAAADLEFITTEMPRAFQRTQEGIDRVAAIVRAMKEFAHPDPSEQSPADINHAITTTLTVARNEYKYIAEVDTDFEELPPVCCNIGELNQVFLNLIVNAAHAIADAGRAGETGRICIRTRELGSKVEIAVADTGCGIPPEHLERIFDPFFTTKEVGRGTGQGLAITRSIVVDKHGGTLDVRSTVGAGTEFVIQLPVAGRPREALAV